MHIALVSLHTSPTETAGQGDAGGMNVVVREQAIALSKLGHRVSIITRATSSIEPGTHPLVLTSDADVLREQRFEPPSVYALGVGPVDLRKNQLTEYLSEFDAEMLRLESGLHEPFDVVHSHYWISGLASEQFLDAREAFTRGSGDSAQQNGTEHTRPLPPRAPHAITLHTVAAQKNAHLAPGDTPETLERIEGEQHLVRTALVIAMSQSELHGIITGYQSTGLGARNISATVINPGVDTELFNPRLFNPRLLNQPGLHSQERPLHLTVLGRQQPLKGQDLAISAFAEFVANYPKLATGAKLTVAGAPTPGNEAYGEKLKQLARQVGQVGQSHQASVEFLPAQSRAQVAALLANSDLVLVPSHSETFGLVALEAAASGTPVLASKVAGLRESVNDYDGKNSNASGVLIDERDPRVWADKIAELVTGHAEHSDDTASSGGPSNLNRKKLNALSKSARKWALKHSWQDHAQELVRSYRSLISD